MDRDEIKPGTRWKEAIHKAIRQGDFFVACFSREYLKRSKTYMNEELTLAIEELRKYTTERAWFIPVLLSECEVPTRNIGAGETLLDIQWVTLFKNWESGVRKLVDLIQPTPPVLKNIVDAMMLPKSANLNDHAYESLCHYTDRSAVTALITLVKGNDVDLSAGAASALGKLEIIVV